ncbi:PEPxxWA-CTERM sorting domain-containing protein [Sphingomonas sp. KR1UV-12]|uniref:PEPxxWA-CTERM sorting domain-containing protein n=1 Tax=Sphingomonas aurea TaxID=3063994 RepID=A0ABT9EKU4_9SPHN|nr:PEPxxWA-CTERM sorting domain-containing protein [Sphingomonas sp. KR1UV-12]MDP1027561.1 PEPxxWA-CTERM sorting domain-containing protein [Sphingomonas sp. KR1UV-12]
MKKIAFAVAAMTVAAAAPASAANLNLVTNGGFESTTTTSSTGNFQIGNAGTVAGWTSTGGYNLLFNAANATTGNAAGTYAYTNKEKMWAANASSQGGNFLALDGDSTARGAVQQVINGLTIGQQYLLTFEWGAGQLQSRDGATTEQLLVGFGNDSFSTTILNNVSHGFTGWNTVSRTFTATSTSQVLSFLSIGTPNGLPPIATLDNVAMTAVPEPATWAMMLVGFAMVGATARYRRRSTNVAIA